MSHHSGTPFEFMNDDELKKFKDSMMQEKSNHNPFDDLIKPFRGKPFGATGTFPAGKLNEQDEGGIQFGMTVHEGKLIMNFGDKPISWIGFTQKEVIDLIKYLNNKVSELK